MDGRWQVWRRSGGGSSFAAQLHDSLAEQLDRPDQLKITQLGVDDAVVCDMSEVITLLRIETVGAGVGEQDATGKTGAVVVLLQVGTPTAWDKLPGAAVK